ncbi:carbonic anhydrase [Kineococcus sp. NPDC059986]|uniref:carbonic anhydrase n=1 Tax=Kineococcus sp. NPDC059986 TaxID=3155538 RepID=UPI003450358F
MASDAPSPGDRRAAAWTRLQHGNRNWVAGTSEAHSARSPQRRADLVDGQTPFAAVLTCADSRVPAELVFDQGPGDLFVVRTAGHAVDDTVLGSLEYAVSVLAVDLVLVLGHEGCGAVAAAARTVEGGPVPRGHLRAVVERLSLHVVAARVAGATRPGDLAQWHAAATGDLLLRRSDVLREAVFHGDLGLLTAVYELASGLVVPTRTRSVQEARHRDALPR